MYNINCTTEVVRDLNDMKKDIRCNMLVALVALFITLLAMPTVTQAQEAYAVENDTTLTFYYDMQKATRRGTVYGDLCAHAWSGSPNAKNSKITKVIFDDSFKGYYPTTTSKWFYCCSSLKEIEGIKNLNTDSVTDMSSMFEFCESLTSLGVSSFSTANVTSMNHMFSNCQSLTSLDVSSFNTAKVTSMSGMFQSCSDLTTVYCDKDWQGDVVQDSKDMFADCSKLKGAAVYDNSKVDVAMANPATGYFTKKNATGIGTVGTDTLQHKQIIYNLSGVRLNIPLDRLPAGVYIVNGHKVMKK